MSDAITRLNEALEGRYNLGEMKNTGRTIRFWFLMPLAVGLLVPSLVLFYLEVFVGVG